MAFMWLYGAPWEAPTRVEGYGPAAAVAGAIRTCWCARRVRGMWDLISCWRSRTGKTSAMFWDETRVGATTGLIGATGACSPYISLMYIAADMFDIPSFIPELWEAFGSFKILSIAGGAPWALVNATVFAGTIVSEVC